MFHSCRIRIDMSAINMTHWIIILDTKMHASCDRVFLSRRASDIQEATNFNRAPYIFQLSLPLPIARASWLIAHKTLLTKSAIKSLINSFHWSFCNGHIKRLQSSVPTIVFFSKIGHCCIANSLQIIAIYHRVFSSSEYTADANRKHRSYLIQAFLFCSSECSIAVEFK